MVASQGAHGVVLGFVWISNVLDPEGLCLSISKVIVTAAVCWCLNGRCYLFIHLSIVSLPSPFDRVGIVTHFTEEIQSPEAAFPSHTAKKWHVCLRSSSTLALYHHSSCFWEGHLLLPRASSRELPEHPEARAMGPEGPRKTQEKRRRVSGLSSGGHGGRGHL